VIIKVTVVIVVGRAQGRGKDMICILSEQIFTNLVIFVIVCGILGTLGLFSRKGGIGRLGGCVNYWGMR